MDYDLYLSHSSLCIDAFMGITGILFELQAFEELSGWCTRRKTNSFKEYSIYIR